MAACLIWFAGRVTRLAIPRRIARPASPVARDGMPGFPAAVCPSVTAAKITNLSEEFDGHVHLLNGLVSKDRLAALIEEAIDGPSRRVQVNGGGVTWEERPVRFGGALWSAMAQSQVTDLATALIGAQIGQITAWANKYAVGERIAWHTDVSGEIQLILLLASPHSPDTSLWLRSKAGPRQLPLAPGDAVLFSASRIEHETLASTDRSLRVSAVMRFFRAEKTDS